MWFFLLLLKNINGKHFLIETAEDIKVNISDYMLQSPGDDLDGNSLDDPTPEVGCIARWNGFRAISCFKPGYVQRCLTESLSESLWGSIQRAFSRQGVDPNCYQERRPQVKSMGECQDKVRIEFSIIV